MIALVLAVLTALSVPAHACRNEAGDPRRGEKACIYNARTTGHGRSFVAITEADGGRMYVYANGIIWL